MGSGVAGKIGAMVGVVTAVVAGVMLLLVPTPKPQGLESPYPAAQAVQVAAETAAAK